MTYTPTLSISENEIMLRIDPGEGYNKVEVEFVWRKNHNYGFLKMYESDHTEFNRVVFLTPEAVRDLIAVMKYSLGVSLEEKKDDD